VDDTIDETVGVSSNNDDWRIHEYKNHKLDKEYQQEYETIKFDIKSDLLENYKKQGYIENK
jgi:DNA-binding ferritin-like protein (Dps family)